MNGSAFSQVETLSSSSEFLRAWVGGEDSERDVIKVKRIYIDINDGNLHDGILFSQIMYWHGNSRETGKPRMTVEKDSHLWLVKAYSDWWLECRIVEDTARKSIKRMCDRGLIITGVWKFNGSPTLHLRINPIILEQKLKLLMADPNAGRTKRRSDTKGQIEVVALKGQIEVTPEDTTGDLSGQIEVTPEGRRSTEITCIDFPETNDQKLPGSGAPDREAALAVFEILETEGVDLDPSTRNDSQKLSPVQNQSPDNETSPAAAKKSKKRKTSKPATAAEIYALLKDRPVFEKAWEWYCQKCNNVLPDTLGKKPDAGDKAEAAWQWVQIIETQGNLDAFRQGCRLFDWSQSGIPHFCRFIAGSQNHPTPYWQSAIEKKEALENPSDFIPDDAGVISVSPQVQRQQQQTLAKAASNWDAAGRAIALVQQRQGVNHDY